MPNTFLKHLLTAAIAILTITITLGQKVPNVQQHSLRPPVNLKIDGKATEWDNKYEAFNHAVNFYYTLCNDDNNLYMVVHASDPDVLSKITNRGVVLYIDPSGKKTDKDAACLTYPVFDLVYGNKPYIRFSNASGLTARQREAVDANPDSVLRVANRKLHESEKYIRTTGISGVDTLISVYNDQDIVAREGFEKGMIYTYELSLPLKYLRLPANGKFAYHIVVPGLNVDKDFGMSTTKMPDGTMLVSFAAGAATIKNDHMPAVISTTDFWAEYTLAK